MIPPLGVSLTQGTTAYSQVNSLLLGGQVAYSPPQFTAIAQPAKNDGNTPQNL